MPSLLLKRIKDWATSIINFRTGDVIPVDGPDGTAKMSKDDLLARTAENALGSIHSLSDTATDFASDDYIAIDGATNASRKMKNDSLLKVTTQNALAKILPAFDPNKSADPETGFAYNVGESVIYYGEIKMFVNGHTGAWVAADAITIQLPQKFATSEVMQRLLGNRLDDSQFTDKGYVVGTGGGIIANSGAGDSGLCPCVPGETLYVWRDLENNQNKFLNSIIYYDEFGHYLTSKYSSATIRADIVPNNAYYFSLPIVYDGDTPIRTVVASFLPNKFIPYFSSQEKIKEVVKTYFIARNLFDPNATTDGSYISSVTNGQEVWTTDASQCMSDYIDVRNGLLFCWSLFTTPNNRWPFLFFVTYDSSKVPIKRHSIGSGRPQVLSIDAGTKYVRIQVGVTAKEQLSVGHYQFSKFVPFGDYGPLMAFDVVQEVGSSEYKVMSQAAVKQAIDDAVVGSSAFDLDLTGCSTDVLFTTRNFVIKEYLENGTRYFEFSKDNGKTFVKVENTIGQINFIHIFSNGRVLICGKTQAFYTDDFATFTSTLVYDYDGSAFSTSVGTFFKLGNNGNEYNVIGDKEVLVWNDYNNEAGYASRVWFTDDKGESLRCILKNNETLDTDGNLISTAHFHSVYLDEKTQKIIVTSGDDGNYCKLLRGSLVEGSWVWDLLNKGERFKFGDIWIKGPYAFTMPDYTGGVYATGLLTCPIDGLDNIDNYSYLFKTDNNEALSHYYEDAAGNKMVTPDSIGYCKFWFAKNNYDFKQCSVSGAGDRAVLKGNYGPSYNGLVVCLVNTSGYSTWINPSMNMSFDRYDLTTAMKNAGVRDFGSVD